MTEAELVAIILISGAGAVFLTHVLELMAMDHKDDE
jgi:hypothetical protein